MIWVNGFENWVDFSGEQKMFVGKSCSYQFINLAMVGGQLYCWNKINQNNIIKPLTHNVYQENTKLVRLVIF